MQKRDARTEPRFCKCGLILQAPMRRCHYCIAERGGNFAALVDRFRGPAQDGPFGERPTEICAVALTYNSRKAPR